LRKIFPLSDIRRKKEKNRSTAEHETSTLKGSDQKLFFLLVYLKTNALQEHQAASFGVSQTKVSRFSKILLELLNESLSKMGLMPYRDGELLIKLQDTVTKFFITMELSVEFCEIVTTQPKRKNIVVKKTHRIKNNVLCDSIQYVYYLSPTESGKTHDFA
jgi:hypothetical protein